MIKPMLAELAERPFDSPDYLFEYKYDGVRAVWTGQELQSREGKRLSDRFPEVQVKTPLPCVLDGELVCLNPQGIPDFNKIQHRIHLADAFRVKILSRQSPATFIAFDILKQGIDDLTSKSLLHRKQALESVRGETFQISPYTIGKGVALFNIAMERGYEGVMAKHLTSTYFQRRSPAWLKVKRIQVGEFMAVGLTAGEGERAETFGSLILAEGYKWVGNVGSGFSRQDLDKWLAMAKDQKSHILYTAHKPYTAMGYPIAEMDKVLFWTNPMPIRVAYMERTAEGHLRFPRLVRTGELR